MSGAIWCVSSLSGATKKIAGIANFSETGVNSTYQLSLDALKEVKTKAELEHYTLELYAARIFDNPKWVDYEAFAKHYGYQPQSYEG